MANLFLNADRYNEFNRKFIPNRGATILTHIYDYDDKDQNRNGYVRLYTSDGKTPDNWYSTVSVTPNAAIPISDGFNATFKLNPGMEFDNYNSFNGMVSLCFAKGDSDFMKTFDNIIPGNLHYSIYDTRNLINKNLPEGDRGGGYAAVLNKSQCDYGFTLTLFPDEGTSVNTNTPPSNSLTQNTQIVSYFKLAYKNSENGKVEYFKGYLPQSIDLSCNTTIEVNNAFDAYHIYANDIEICNIPNVNIDTGADYNIRGLISDCRVAFCAMGQWNSPVDFDILNIGYTNPTNY